MDNSNAVNQLNSYLTVLISLVKELVPEPYSIADIEKRSNITSKLIASFIPVHDKLWDNLEIVLKADSNDTINYQHLKEFYGNFEKYFRSFHQKYTTKTNRQFPTHKDQFTLPLAHNNLNIFFGMIEHDYALLSLFYSYFALSFPIPGYDDEPNVFINHASPVSIQLFEKLKRVKPEWDKLPDYESKLLFWFKQGLQIDERTYHLSENINDLTYRVSIYPETNEEKAAWKHFYFEKFNKYNFNTFETSQATYYKHIEDGADPIPYTKTVIELIDKEYINHEKIKLNNISDYCEGYKASQNGQIKRYLDSYILPYSMRDFCTGVVHEKYKRFLKEQLKKLELGSVNPVSPVNIQLQKINFEFEYFLRQYIDIALRWQISSSTEFALKWYYENARTKWEKFKQEYRQYKRNFNELEKGNFYDDLVNDFYPMIEAYIAFYNNNFTIIGQTVTHKVNTYSVLLDLCKDTKKEVEILNARSTVSPTKNSEIVIPIKNNETVILVKSYTWSGNHNTPKILYRLLKEEGCVPENTAINDFLFIFTGKPEGTLLGPLKWCKSNRLLAYLIFSLKDKKLITDSDWQSKAGKGKFFITAKGKAITANDLAKATSDCNKFEIKPENAEIVDTILKALISKQQVS